MNIFDTRLSGKFDTNSWIIDTGATHHITSNIACLFDIHKTVDCLISYPNDSTIVQIK